ncbi:MAG: ParB N-terminal domain-containing protein [Gemmataceae bacterium]
MISRASGNGQTQKKRKHRKSKLDHDPVLTLPIAALRPATINNCIYRPVSADDPGIRALADSIATQGQLDDVVITNDKVILSGHRRVCACQLLGITHIRCRIDPILSTDPGFEARLVAYNRQRVKNNKELLHEEVILADPDEGYEALIAHRKAQSRIKVDAVVVGARRHRSKISAAKSEFLAAAKAIIKRLRDFWPLSVRQIHYQLLNNPPLKHGRKSDSRYQNDDASYKALVNLLTRARHEGSIAFEAIDDPTRPVTTWNVHRSPAEFIRKELDGFLKGYWRDLLQSQPNHIELFAEKNTVQTVLRQVASKYRAPLTVGRGYCSLPPLKAMVRRFRQSGKEKLIVLFVTDCDPEGMNIPVAITKTLRDDLGVSDVFPIKVALTRKQVQAFKLPSMTVAKAGSSRTKAYKKEHGQHVWELEALSPERLSKIVGNAIDSVLDVAAFNAEVDAEKRDAAFLQAVRNRGAEALKGIDAEDDD